MLSRAIHSRVTPGSGRGNAAGKRDAEFVEERFIAEQAIVAFDFGGEAAAGENLRVLRGRPNQIPRPRGIDDGVGQRMVRSLLGSGGHAQQIVLRVAGERVNAIQHRSAHGEGSGLVENDCIQMGQAFQSFSAFEENPELRAAAHCNCERGGYGQTHGAGAGDHQHGNGVCQCQREANARR